MQYSFKLTSDNIDFVKTEGAEIIIPLTNFDNFVQYIIQNFTAENNLVLYLEKEVDDISYFMTKVLYLQRIFTTLKIAIDHYDSNKSIQSECKKNNIPFFFKMIVDDFQLLHNFISHGVSDVYIGGALGFDIATASRYCRQNNVKVRVIPNMAQGLFIFDQPDITAFFIRPEDMKYYREEIDIIEFAGDPGKQNIYHKIYSKEAWDGFLDDLIIGINIPINNRLISQATYINFAKARMNCKGRCKYGQCNYCDRMQEILENLIKEDKENEF